MQRGAVVLALAGRRIDAANSTVPRFPLTSIDLVRKRLSCFLRNRRVTDVVCGAACGADLLALDVAGELGVHRRVIVVGSLEQYKRSSVTDRPGDWGPLFDRIAAAVAATGDLVVLSEVLESEEDARYAIVNEAILDEAERVRGMTSRDTRLVALLVWDGVSRGPGDVTEAFARSARWRGIPVEELPTQ
jgi:hypothetical protein